MFNDYHEFEVGAKTLRLRISSRYVSKLEKSLGTSLLAYFAKLVSQMESAESELEAISYAPDVDTYALIFHAALQEYEHGYSLDDVYGLFDRFVRDGHTYMELMAHVMKILQVSGVVPRQVQEPQEVKPEE